MNLMCLFKRTRWLIGVGWLAGTALHIGTLPTLAEGSRTLYPNGALGNRANIEWRTNQYGNPNFVTGGGFGGVLRRTLLKVYAKAGENMLVGSTANGVAGDGSAVGSILIYNPNRISGFIGSESIPGTPDFDCNTDQPGNGTITNRTEELAGPESVDGLNNLAGYTPCTYVAPVEGIYDVIFTGPDGFNTSSNGSVAADVALSNPNNFNGNQGGTIAGWDVTVRSNDPSSTTDFEGRLFAYYFAFFTGGNGRPLFYTTYPITNDGYRYSNELRGLDPNGALFYGNQVGFFDSDGQTPLYHDVIGDGFQINNPEGGVRFSRPQFPIFFNLVDTDALPFIQTYNPDGTDGSIGIPSIPAPPNISAPVFVGNSSGNSSFLGGGGTFTFSTSIAGNYQIIISSDNDPSDGTNFDPTDPTNRVLRGTLNTPGAATVSWNGQDNAGNDFPVGDDYPVRLTVHAGEYHFPFLDAENDAQGSTITLLNAVNPLGNTTAFYDDRTYRTLNGTTVGIPPQTLPVGSTALCGINAPSPTFSDPLNGFSTTSFDRAFGQTSGGNTNTKCTGSFGDTKGLDLWTYLPTSPSFIPLNVISNSQLLLVKRITAVNGVDISGFDNNDGRTEDDNANWPTPKSTSLRGSTSSGIIAPGDEVEFTIYFLSGGGSDVTNVRLCDLVPDNMTFAADAFAGLAPLDAGGLSGTDVGIALGFDDASVPSTPSVYLTNLADGDRGQFFSPNTEAPAACNENNFSVPLSALENLRGAVVVDVATNPDVIPNATNPGDPANSYGFIRFRAIVD